MDTIMRMFSRNLFAWSATGLFLFLTCAAAADKYSYNNQGRRDPFMSLITPAGYLVNLEAQGNATLRLEGVMYDPKGGSMAIINGELLKVGDAISDSVVTDIEQDSVTVVKNNEKTVLPLEKEE